MKSTTSTKTQLLLLVLQFLIYSSVKAEHAPLNPNTRPTGAIGRQEIGQSIDWESRGRKVSFSRELLNLDAAKKFCASRNMNLASFTEFVSESSNVIKNVGTQINTDYMFWVMHEGTARWATLIPTKLLTDTVSTKDPVYTLCLGKTLTPLVPIPNQPPPVVNLPPPEKFCVGATYSAYGLIVKNVPPVRSYVCGRGKTEPEARQEALAGCRRTVTPGPNPQYGVIFSACTSYAGSCFTTHDDCEREISRLTGFPNLPPSGF